MRNILYLFHPPKIFVRHPFCSDLIQDFFYMKGDNNHSYYLFQKIIDNKNDKRISHQLF